LFFVLFCAPFLFLFFRFLGLGWWWFLPLQHPLKNRTDGGWEGKKGKRAEKQATQGFTGKMPIVENLVCRECKTAHNTLQYVSND
jgi:hypothetical protein